MRGLRHTDEWVGLLVLAAFGVLLAAILQAGVLRDWFRPTEELRLILPESGVAGLVAGADVEVLGTKAGTVERIVIDPRQQMNAIIRLDEQAKTFVRRDSTAVIRRRFGVAGAAFVDISRGSGPELDWSYAVIVATTERAPTDSISALIDEVREKVFPILDNTGRATHALAEIVERVNRGEGNLGELLVDDKMMREVDRTVANAGEVVNSLNVLMVELQGVAGDVRGLTGKLNAEDGVPSVVAKSRAALDRADTVLADLHGVMGSLQETMKRTPAIAKNLESSTANLPALLSQMQVTLAKLDELMTQLRGSWLLGGNSAPIQQPKQFSPSQVLP
jgi:phospholipid/cholesterol/gamma-HCH transport system substrate-binding protein